MMKGDSNSTFKFGFGCGGNPRTSDQDKDEILVPINVQELIHRSIRTLSNSISNRSPEDAMIGQRMRDSSFPLVPVSEIETMLETKWFTLEEQFQEEMMNSLLEETKVIEGPVQPSNPFRMLPKKEKEQQVVGSNLDVKRVKYQYKQTSPGDEKQHLSPEQEESAKGGKDAARPTPSPFQPALAGSGKEGVRGNAKGCRRAGP